MPAQIVRLLEAEQAIVNLGGNGKNLLNEIKDKKT